MVNYKNLIGETKGIFTLVEILNNNTGLFYCSVCNEKHTGHLHSWYYNGRKKCGNKNTKHRLYDRYYRMVERCYVPNSPRYPYYGARGITVCESWRASFKNFLNDMEDSFEEGLELDRIDNGKGYYPENCRWVSHSANMLNRRGFKNETNYPGVRKTPYNTYVGRCQINKKGYSTKSYKTPIKAYEALQELKLTLISEMK